MDKLIILQEINNTSEVTHIRWSYEDDILAVAHLNCSIYIWNPYQAKLL